ncbi:protein kinase [bacterium]|nr:protein kinase [bacterium]
MPDSRQEFPPSLLARYLDPSFVGEGAMGQVFRARDKALDSIVAIKILARGAEDQDLIRLQREAKTLAQLNHPNIVRVLDFNLTKTQVPYLVMEYVEGRDLCSLGLSSLRELLPVLIQVCAGMVYAHREGVLHRDLKPSNILLDASASQVKIVDFGIAKHFSSEVDTTSGAVVRGTPAYMSPEQANGESVDERSDIYSFGCILYEVIVGRKPFIAESSLEMIMQHASSPVPSVEREDCPDMLEQLILSCLAKLPEERPHSFSAILEILESVLASLPVPVEAGEKIREAVRGAETFFPLPEQEDKRQSGRLQLALIVLPVLAIAGVLYLGSLVLQDSSQIAMTQKEGGVAIKKQTEGVRLNQSKVYDLPDAFKDLKIPKLLRVARDLIKQEKYGTAIACFSRILQEEPKNEGALLGRAECYMHMELIDDAIKDLNLFLAKLPDQKEAISLRANCYRMNGQYQKSFDDYSRLIELNPEDESFYVQRAKLSALEDNLDKALVDVDKAVELKPGSGSFLRMRSSFLQRLGRYDEVVRDLSTALTLEKNNSNMYYNRGCAYFELGKYDKALEDFSQAIKMKPGRADYYQMRARVYEKLGKVDLAREDREKMRIDDFTLKF